MRLSNYDKQQIYLINEQVTLLQQKGASDAAILEALFDFVPEVKCLIDTIDAAELRAAAKPGFSYFIELISE